MAKKYDVYLSFRSEDVGNGFVSHLAAALRGRDIRSYGEQNPKAIEESKVSVIIFSDNYCDCIKCLDEMVRIMRNPPWVIPVFYHLHPSDLRQKYHTTDDDDKPIEWRQALEQACNLTGWISSSIRSEYELVEGIVEDVVRKLNRIASNSESECLVGLEERVKKIESLLSIGSLDAILIIGIWGMAGLGKTTLARVVYDRLSFRFDTCSFLPGIREKTGRHGVIHLRDELLVDLFGEDDERMHRKKVLVVLDDVDNSNQFEILARQHNRFGHGSRIIITTRDLQLLRNVGAHYVYRVEGLNSHESLQLFYDSAFRQVSPSLQHKELSERAVNYAGGNPLVIKLLGSFLRDNMKLKDWREVVDKLEISSYKTVANVLRISYGALDHTEGDVFLDIALFCIGCERDLVEDMLGEDNFSVTATIDSLIEKSLLSLDHSNKLQMHDLVRDMGLEIVRQQSFEQPESRSRLWNTQDIYTLLEDNIGTPKAKGLFLDMSKMGNAQLTSTNFRQSKHLRLLSISHDHSTKMLALNPEASELLQFPGSLRYLCWTRYPFKSLPKEFSPRNLVKLHLPSSQLEQLSIDPMDLVNLTKIDLSYSKKLFKVPDLSRATKLKEINLQCCTSLSTIPSLLYLENLWTLSLNGCSSLDMFPELPMSIKILDLSETRIEKVPVAIGSLHSLETLKLNSCKALKNLPSAICRLKSLQCLGLSDCSNLETFPEISEPMEHLRVLNLKRSGICELPSSLGKLICLEELHLNGCSNLKLLPTDIYKLKNLEIMIASDCVELRKLPDSGQIACLSLTRLQLSNSGIVEIPDQLSSLFELESLDLSGNIITKLPTSFSKLTKLKRLFLYNCEKLQALPEIPLSVEFVDAHSCKSLQRVSISKTALARDLDQFPVSSEELLFINCLNLDQNARRNLISDSHLGFLLMASTSRHRSKHELGHSSVSICYLGKKVPKWFNYQSKGSSIKVKLPQNWRNTNFLGFAMCVVAAPFPVDKRLPEIHFQCEYHFQTKDGKSHEFKRFFRGYSHFNTIFLCSDHLFAWYDYLDGVEDVFTEALFEFHTADIWDRKVDLGYIKSCGVRLLYLQDTLSFGSKEQLNDFDSDSETGESSTHKSHGITELQPGEEDEEEEEETAITHESEERPNVINQEDKSNSCECLLFLDKIKECYDNIVGKKPISNEVKIENMNLQIQQLNDQSKRVLEYLQCRGQGQHTRKDRVPT